MLTDFPEPVKLLSLLIAVSRADATAVLVSYVAAGKVTVFDATPSTDIWKVLPLDTVKVFWDVIAVASFEPDQPLTGVKNAFILLS